MKFMSNTVVSINLILDIVLLYVIHSIAIWNESERTRNKILLEVEAAEGDRRCVSRSEGGV